MIRDDIRTGRIYHVGADCGVPHGFRPIYFRVIRVDPKATYHGYAWLDGYELDGHGAAVERRSIFVIAAGLKPVGGRPAPARRARNQRRPQPSPEPIRSIR